MKQDRFIGVRVNAVDKARIEAAAHLSQRKIGDYCRLAILTQVSNDLQDGGIPSETPPHSIVTREDYVKDAILPDVIEHLTEENYEPVLTFRDSPPGRYVCTPCSALCHILLIANGGLIQSSVLKDCQRILAPIASPEFVELLNSHLWPLDWLRQNHLVKVDWLVSPRLQTIEIAGDLFFTPDLEQTKAILQSLMDGLLPNQKGSA